MKRLIRFLARLYPTRWRERYGEEFDALLEDSLPRWRDAWDVARLGVGLAARRRAGDRYLGI